jgi:hypothetical protein
LLASGLQAPTIQGHGLIGRWSPGIGDPTWGGWLTVLAYALVAFLCFRVLSSRQKLRPAERTLWRVLCFSLVALGINKQLDLLSGLTEGGRVAFQALDLYAFKRWIQLAFIATVAAIGIVATTWLLRLARAAPFITRVAVAGFALVVLFVGIRAASFHHIDHFIGVDVGGVRVNWLLELGGLTVLGVAAARRVRLGPLPKAR